MFVNLHVHTQYSILDGAIQIPELVTHLKANGMNSCAITDHGSMAGVVQFYKACVKENIKPLIGIEFYTTNDKDNLQNDKRHRDNHHLVVIAKDNIGYSLLSELISNAYMSNFYYKPRVYKEHLRRLRGHCVCLTACLGNWIGQGLKWEYDSNNQVIACVDEGGFIEKSLDFYRNIFNEDFYLEIQVWDDPTNTQQIYNQWIINVGRRLGIPIVITADCHYLTQEHFKLHQILMAMQLKMTIQEYQQSKTMKLENAFYVASPQEMMNRTISVNCEEAYYNTIDISKKCNVEIELGKYELPIFDITKQTDYQEFLQWLKDN